MLERSRHLFACGLRWIKRHVRLFVVALCLIASSVLIGSAAVPRLQQPRSIVMHSGCSNSIAYPPAARRAGFEGKVTLRFKVQPNGSVEAIQVQPPTLIGRNGRRLQPASSQDHRSRNTAKQLEQAAMRSISSCRFPAELAWGPAWAEVPIEFRFADN